MLVLRDNLRGRSIDAVLMPRPTAEQVDEQWAHVFVDKALALDLSENEEFRKAVLLTARAGSNYVDAEKCDSRLPKRTKLTTSCIPDLDKKLEAKVRKRVDALLAETGSCLCACPACRQSVSGGLLISDGWTSVQSRPIINALLATPVGCRFLKALFETQHFNLLRIIKISI